jgi:hypothetical protein
VFDVMTDTFEDLDFKDRVQLHHPPLLLRLYVFLFVCGSNSFLFAEQILSVSLGFDHLVAASAGQCSAYSVQSWSTAPTVDIKESPMFVLQCDKYVLFAVGVSLSVCVSVW